uniref:Tick transposon n=1 Tax=Rhipicephalus appendiculatus TaxID=34631 RepID=A0A131YJM0_RHIAP
MIKMASHAEFRIWQWNCGGILSKRGTLQQFVRSHSEKPQVILLQETLSDSVTLPGYKAHVFKGEGRGIATLVSSEFTFVTHDLGVRPRKMEISLVEVISSASNLSSILILNIYSSPSDHRQRFKTYHS